MNDDQVWLAIDRQRAAVAELLGALRPEEWEHASLCEGWTVRDVAAHLTLQELRFGQLLTSLPAMVRARFDVERLTSDLARARARELTPEAIVAAIRATVGNRRHNAGVTVRETLIDILVHGQDIAVPLGRELPTAPDAVAEAITRMWTMRWPPPFPATKRLRGHRLEATDADFAIGDGPVICGPITALALLCAGRDAAARPRVSAF
ncbi:maleylpyruvate isomerase family mycothiol-dependent enzyme [Dactylosporangium sp. AC04546]|uniref:maleylpyruvate isomerase family mycothiol-dependent enzyme n=1 Tax=Dactylosporangium sp. AC04546 TaxID=2862460 RepID=UPI001EDDB660|nr:maleylpyruvate isomerase family mycothiol-dependent enzyme [Dactylosporangium sp. AC04546]WVK87940.1 maleylpyruvate isomerase family mycothiol-dependent enzyme [Dactylosporangium sp. AC04546]